MKAVEISSPGGPEVLKLVERPMPQPAAGEVLIKVTAAGVNRPDTFQRAGNYPPPPGASDLPGLEIAGEIVGGLYYHNYAAGTGLAAGAVFGRIAGAGAAGAARAA